MKKFISDLAGSFLPNGRRNKKFLSYLGAACIFLAVFYCFNLPGIIAEADNLTAENTSRLRLVANVTYYIGAVFATSFTLYCCLTSKYKFFRTVFWVLASMAFFDITYRFLTSSYITISEFVFLLNERKLFADASLNYIRYIVISAVIFAAVIISTEKFMPSWLRNSIPRWCLVLMLAASFGIVFLSLELSNGRRDRYVAQFRIPAIIAYSLAHPDSPAVGLNQRIMPRGSPEAPTGEPSADIVILVVDESIVAYALGINGSKFDSTPKLSGPYKNRYINLGIASSSGNGSASSNYILRNNIQLSQLPDVQQTTLGLPSLFSYAKKAGFKTYLIDAQAQTDALQNYMNKYDLEDIDVYYPVKSSNKSYNKDFMVNAYLQKEISGAQGKKFFFVVKQGLHFPYNARYPYDSINFTPDFGSSEAISYSSADAQKMINTYLNAISWNVDTYLADLFDRLQDDFQCIALVYTSDHGQSVAHKTKNRPHGTLTDPPMAEASVPIILFGGAFQKDDLQYAKDCYSHFQIGPTILTIFGYRVNDINIFDGCPRERKIYTGSPFSSSSYKYDFCKDDEALKIWH